MSSDFSGLSFLFFSPSGKDFTTPTGGAFANFHHSITGLASWYIGVLYYQTLCVLLPFCLSIVIKMNVIPPGGQHVLCPLLHLWPSRQHSWIQSIAQWIMRRMWSIWTRYTRPGLTLVPMSASLHRFRLRGNFKLRLGTARSFTEQPPSPQYKRYYASVLTLPGLQPPHPAPDSPPHWCCSIASCIGYLLVSCTLLLYLLHCVYTPSMLLCVSLDCSVDGVSPPSGAIRN